ncbi:MAG TPA: aryldialkylphosphatase [bacterium]|nr:aryldialkylphosphatase [bacterium]
MLDVVQTVLGPIPASDLGITLSHEHLLCDQRHVTFKEPAEPEERELARRPVSLEILHWIQLNWGSNLDNLVLDSEQAAIDEALWYRRAGGNSLVDCTLEGLGRNPHALVRIARASGLHIVMGSGYYVAPTHPPHVARMTEDEITAEIIREFTEGVAETGIRAGLIGEIGSSWPIVAEEAKVFRAAGAAQRELGCGLSVHPGRHPNSPLQILELLRPAGADPKRLIISHIERTVPSLDELKVLADTGCYLEYDLFGTEVTAKYPYRELGIDIPSDVQRLDQIRELFDAGYGSQLLFSHDVCTKHRTRRYGGAGFDHILRNIVPWMRARGFTEPEIRQPVVDNPRVAFAMPKTR